MPLKSNRLKNRSLDVLYFHKHRVSKLWAFIKYGDYNAVNCFISTHLV